MKNLTFQFSPVYAPGLAQHLTVSIRSEAPSTCMNVQSKQPNSGGSRIRPVQFAGRPSPKEIVRDVMAARKAYRLAGGGVKGRFATQEDLTTFLSYEIASGRQYKNIALAAGISNLSLRRLIDAEKVPLAENHCNRCRASLLISAHK